LEQDLKKLLADANSAFQTKDYDLAEKLYLSVLEIDLESATAHYALGTIALQRKDYGTALAGLEKASELEPNAVDITYNYAICLAQTGNIERALVTAQRATKYCGDDPVFCSRLAMLFHDLGEPKATIQLLLRLKTLTPQDQIVLAKANGQLNNWQEAVDILQRLSEALPKEARVANDLAIAAGSLKDFDLAVSAFERYLTLVRPSANDYLRFADLLFMAQRVDRCDQAIEQALDCGEDGAQIYVLKANVARLEGSYDSAVEALDEALLRMPNHGTAWSMRAELGDKNSLSKYIDELQEVLSNDADLKAINRQHRALLNYALGDMQARTESYEAAANSWRNANAIQHELLRNNMAAYSEQQTEDHILGLINDFSLQVFDKPGARTDELADSKQPIFIVGMPRSGTTLVERIIGQNRKVFCAGEQEAMEFIANDFTRRRMEDRLPEPTLISPEQWAEMRIDYMQKLPKFSQAIFTDKLPHNFRHAGIILKLFPKARIIQMRRNIQDVCLSIYSRAFTTSHNYANRWEDLSHFYRQSEKLMNHWSSLNSPRVLDMKYENLVESPEYFAKQLVEFCGFEWDESYLQFHETLNKSFTFSEMQVRESITINRIDRWKLYQEGFPELLEL